MNAVITALEVVCLLSTLLLIAGVLAQRGSGGGLSDLLVGGGSPLAYSAHANRNLTRLTLAAALVWTGAVVALGLLT